jgi:hypothetical protein
MSFMIRRTVLMTTEQADRLTWEFVEDSPAKEYRRGVMIFRVDDREVVRLPVY